MYLHFSTAEASTTLPLLSVSASSLTCSFALRKSYAVMTELSTVPVTAMVYLWPSSSKNSMFPVKDMGWSQDSEISTGRDPFAMPIILPSGKSISTGSRSVSVGRWYRSSRLSYPSFRMLKVALVLKPSGTGGKTTSCLSKTNEGNFPSPKTSTST